MLQRYEKFLNFANIFATFFVEILHLLHVNYSLKNLEVSEKVSIFAHGINKTELYV